MRRPLLLLPCALASVLVAACGGGTPSESGGSQQSIATPSATRTTATTTPSGTSATAAPPSGAPRQGADVAAVIAWIEAGKPADPSAFHSATRDGVETPLGDDFAFVTANTEANCMTNPSRDHTLACLVKLTDPPPRPAGTEGMWKGNWIDFTGTTLEVGSVRGDPGPFGSGTGAELPPGQSLAFGDYRCRADAAGLFCVNYAHRSAARLSASGVEPFGCLEEQTPADPGIGRQFGC